MHSSYIMHAALPALGLILIPLLTAACGGSDAGAFTQDLSAERGAGAAGSAGGPSSPADASAYRGPVVG
ncbi:MAG: hypothetical protein ABW061_21870, partial [Polyangiaceae bacterium]